MHIHFEHNTCTRTDSNFLCLSWMGKVPDDLPEEGGGWKLNRAQYYVEGWLASGNARGVVGVTFTTSHCHSYDAPPRSNFNLRGHRSEVVFVRWNEPYQKLATCDSRGIIFVWIKHEGRWSVELINDRNSQVTDFAWSHDGRMALICYKDGFILVGSVAGQRHWSSTLNQDITSITCGVWSPDDQQVMFGTVDGQIVVMSSTGTIVSQVTVNEGFEITGMAWSCEKFNMEEVETNGTGDDHGIRDTSPRCHILATCFKNGDIFLMSGYDDICPVIVSTSLTGVKIDWSNCGKYLAVGGFVRLQNLECHNELRLYSKDGSFICWASVPSQGMDNVALRLNETAGRNLQVTVCVKGKPLTAMTWGHCDKRLFLAAGCYLYIACVSKHVSSLQFLCQQVVHQRLHSVKAVHSLPLPQTLQGGVKALFSPTLKSYIPDPLRLREFVCSPPPGGERLFCTMIRHGDEALSGHYTLYLEYLGGLVPLLKGKRASKLRPDFIIFDPKIKSLGKAEQSQVGTVESDPSSESDKDIQPEGCGSPRMQRRRRQKKFRAERVNRNLTFRTLDELMFDANLPETNRLAMVTSNIWGTKFQIIGVASSLPANLGQVQYKTSLLHLQPRQMTVTITEIPPSHPALYRDPNFTPAPNSTDDEDDVSSSEGELVGEKRPVEITVRDTLSVQSALRGEGSGVDVGRRSVSVDRFPVNGESGNPEWTLGTFGAVRSRSMSPVCSLLRQTVPDVKKDGANRLTRQDRSSRRSRSKAYQEKQGGKTSDSGHKASNVPKWHDASDENTGLGFQCSDACADMTHLSSPITETFVPSSSPTSGSCKRQENPSGINCVDSSEKGLLCSVSKDGTLHDTGTNSLPLFKDHSKVSVHDTNQGCSVIASNVIISFNDTFKGEGPRWADPAAVAMKYLEGETPDLSDMPVENNLVADCIVTAPNCLDLHRRLYLEQQNINDTGTPISPKTCPSCMSVQISSDQGCSISRITLEADSDYENDSGSPRYFLAESRVPDGRKKSEGEAAESSSMHSFSSGQNNNSLAHSQQRELSASVDRNEIYSSVTASSNCPSLQVTRSNGSSLDTQEVNSQLTEDLSKSHHSRHPTSLPQLSVLQNKQSQTSSVKKVKHGSESESHSRHLEQNDYFSDHPRSETASPLHSVLPKDFSSVDRLDLILSEDPSFKNSKHNFQSMPGFFMKNPYHDKECFSSSDKDIFARTNDQLPALTSGTDGLLDRLSLDAQIQHISASVPSSPIRFGSKQNLVIQNFEDTSRGRCKHLSPLLSRKRQSILSPSPDFFGFDSPKLNLKLQKSQLRQKVRQSLLEASLHCESARTFTMHNKAPLWNETSQVYQLDFGGRVTQESAKNFQIDFRGKQVMQFGRIENNAYTLDFQHPFTAVQAFAVALANVTQRLK